MTPKNLLAALLAATLALAACDAGGPDAPPAPVTLNGLYTAEWEGAFTSSPDRTYDESYELRLDLGEASGGGADPRGTLSLSGPSRLISGSGTWTADAAEFSGRRLRDGVDGATSSVRFRVPLDYATVLLFEGTQSHADSTVTGRLHGVIENRTGVDTQVTLRPHRE